MAVSKTKDEILVTYPDGEQVVYTAEESGCHCDEPNPPTPGGGYDTSDATALANDLRINKIAYGKNGKFVGTIANYAGRKENL